MRRIHKMTNNEQFLSAHRCAEHENVCFGQWNNMRFNLLDLVLVSFAVDVVATRLVWQPPFAVSRIHFNHFCNQWVRAHCELNWIISNNFCVKRKCKQNKNDFFSNDKIICRNWMDIVLYCVVLCVNAMMLSCLLRRCVCRVRAHAEKSTIQLKDDSKVQRNQMYNWIIYTPLKRYLWTTMRHAHNWKVSVGPSRAM